ncbi:MAG: glycosyltransferase family 39 protein [Anaerolineae bacterium]|nr:glycosyltransferase family 39 protein [Anaerolineae bacterium]
MMLLILLLAAGERILHIGDQSMWLDEGISYWNQKQPDMIAWISVKDVHPPLYFWLLKGWIGLTGTSAVAMRLFSALAAMLSVAAVVPLARLIARDRSRDEYWSIPLVAALLLAISDPEISLAQDVRMYSLRTLLALGSVFFYLRWANKPGGLRAALWVGTLVALYHTNYIGVYMAAIEGLHALICLRGRVRAGAIGLLALSGALFAPWFLAYGWGQRNTDPGIDAALPSNWNTLVELGFKYFSHMWTIMIGLMLFGLVRYQDGRIRVKPLGSTYLLTLWVGLTVIATYVINFWLIFLSPRRILLLSPALAILTARGLANFKNPARIFLVVCILIYGLATVDDYYPKAPWDQVAEGLAQYAHPDELVLMEIYRDDFTMDYYIDTLIAPETPRESLRLWREDRAAEYPDGLIAEIAGRDVVWLVHWSPDQSAFRFLAQTGHVQTAKLSVDHVGNSLDVYRFDRMPDASIDAFANGVTLRQFEILPGDDRVDLWWSADAPLDRDYTTSVFVLDTSGRLVAQHDAFPFENRRPTTGWQPGEVIYDPHPLDLSALAPGQYTVAVQIYTWQDQVKQPTSGGDPWLVLAELAR